MIRLFAIVVVALSLSACSSDKDKKGSGGGSGSDYLASYELEDSCSTGRQVFSATTVEGIRDAFCAGLKDNERNNGCALYQREQQFESLECPGTWPHAREAGMNSSASTSYALQVNGCSTGLHVFGARTQEAMLRMYCPALKDESLNRSCAKSSRNEKYAESECDEI